MVRGQSKTAAAKKPAAAAATKTAAAATVSPHPNSKTPPVAPPVAIASCSTCGIQINDDSCALQCDRCQTGQWKCIDCLSIPVELYEKLFIPQCNLKWFCDKCDKVIMEGNDKVVVSQSCTSNHDNDDRIDKLVSVVEKLVEKSMSVEDKLRDKADQSTITQLDTRIKRLEDQFQKREQSLELRLAAVDTNVTRIVTERLREFDESRSNQHDAAVVEQAVKEKLDEDKDIEGRRNNIVIYRIPEKLTDALEARKESDSTFVEDLLDSVFQIRASGSDIRKMFRLGRPVEGSDAPRPLLVSFAKFEDKEHVMSNLRKLKQADERFRGISMSHDLTPRQRNEVKLLLATAKKEHEENSNEAAENFRFLVVGQGTKPRVIKIRKEQ